MANRWDKLGNFELVVLLALMRLNDEAYGLPIFEEIEARLGRDVPLGSVYAALGRLEEKGYVTSRLGEPTAARGGKAKRFFKVTADRRARGVRRPPHAGEHVAGAAGGARGAARFDGSKVRGLEGARSGVLAGSPWTAGVSRGFRPRRETVVKRIALITSLALACAAGAARSPRRCSTGTVAARAADQGGGSARTQEGGAAAATRHLQAGAHAVGRSGYRRRLQQQRRERHSVRAPGSFAGRKLVGHHARPSSPSSRSSARIRRSRARPDSASSPVRPVRCTGSRTTTPPTAARGW